MKTVFTLFMVAMQFYLLAALAMYLLQRKLIYYPTPEIVHPFTERSVTVEDGVSLRVIEVNPQNRDAVIYFGGNAEAVADTATELSAALPDHAIYLVNYRGYGGSDGQPTESGLFSDAVSIFDELTQLRPHNGGKISVIGRSLGSGVACWLASRKSVDRLVLITPYDSILNVAKSAYPIFPVRWLLKDRFESDKYAASIKAPVLALIAEHDTIIPLQSSQQLLQHFPTEPTVRILENTGHNDIQANQDYYPTIRDFLK